MINLNKIRANDIEGVKLTLASPEQVLNWSFGEITKPETINYKSQKAETDGLFCEKIFGPIKDWECSCGKYKKVRFKGTKCERCEVDVVSSVVRRQRTGHIELASPVFHIWYLNEFVTKVLNIKLSDIKEVVYFVSHIVLDKGNSEELFNKEVLKENDARKKFKAIIEKIAETTSDHDDKIRALDYVAKLGTKKEAFEFHVYSQFISRYTGARFGIGAEAILELLEKINIKNEIKATKKEIAKTKSFFVGGSVKKKTIMPKLERLTWFDESGNQPEWLVLKRIPVLPPDLRPMIELEGGRFTTSDVNDLYRRIIIRNNRLKKLIELQAPLVIIYNEKRMLQESVDALIANGSGNKKVVTGQGGRALKSLSDSLKGKQGRFRQNLLGKRVDYSGRSVIAVGPELKMYECGLPRNMAASLFKPFIVQQLVELQYAPNIKAADKMVEHQEPVIWPILNDVIAHRPVLLNRAPTLHRLGIQAFMPKLVTGKAIRLHPLVTPAFNADFDGDQMAVHVPLSEEAVAEAKILMIGSSNILGPKDGKPIVTPSQDMVLGNYYVTKEIRGLKGEGTIFRNIDEVNQALDNGKVDLHAVVIISCKNYVEKGFEASHYIITTPGKIILNSIFTNDFPYINSDADIGVLPIDKKYIITSANKIKSEFKKYKINQPFKKSTLSKIIAEIFKKHSLIETSSILDKMKDIGFKYSTISGSTISIGDIERYDYKHELFGEAQKRIEQIQDVYKQGMLTNSERHSHVVKVWSQVKDKVQDNIEEQFNKDVDNPIFMMSDSGARGNISNFTQLSGMRGLMASPYGDIIELPIKSSFIDGLDVSEFFISTHGARKGIADTAFKTGTSGYLTRILVDAAQDITVLEEDCGIDKGLMVEKIIDVKTNTVIVPLAKRLLGRIANQTVLDAQGETIIEFGEEILEDHVDAISNEGIEKVEIRSITTCKTPRGVCQNCYGRNLANNQLVQIGEAVGVIAAQSVGEPGTQLTMRTFHTGGVAGQADITQGLPRILELLTVRWNLKNKAVISEINGEITYAKTKNGISEVIVSNKLNKRKYKFTNHCRVKKGDKVKLGEKLSDGSICPRELLYISDESHVQEYIIKEVQRVFSLQGIDISDKHIEIFTKKMLRKIVVLDEGDTGLLQGKFIDRHLFTEANKKVLAAGKKPAIAKPIIEGIMSVSENNESFIATSSFQTTTKKLREAAVEGKIDKLTGIKENVVVGKLIPAGTGIPKFRDNLMTKYNIMLSSEE